MKKIRIGSGAGYGGDRLDPALTLLREGNLDYIGFECLAERTIALAQKEKKQDATKGYNHLLDYRMRGVLPLLKKCRTKVITNMGAANPEAAMLRTVEIARELSISDLKIACVVGDDVLSLLTDLDAYEIMETGEKLSTLKGKILSANAYLGVAPIVQALEDGADVVITGRVADPALFIAPMVHEFKWNTDDYELMGAGTLIGHLLECAGQVSGGYFADPGRKDVPDLWNLGFPLVEVDESGSGIITKVPGTGGRIDRATCTEQMLYEIHDPKSYLTPDCVADFSNVVFEEQQMDKVAFSKASGRPPTDTYKVSVGYENGYFGEGEISYGGPNCLERASLAKQILQKRLESLKDQMEDLVFDFIGLDAISPTTSGPASLNEVRLRVACRSGDKSVATAVANEVETLYTNGPAGGGGATKKVSEVISVVSILLPKNLVKTKVIYQDV